MPGKKECGSIEERCDKESRCGTDANLTRSNIHPCLKKGFAEPPPQGLSAKPSLCGANCSGRNIDTVSVCRCRRCVCARRRERV